MFRFALSISDPSVLTSLMRKSRSTEFKSVKKSLWPEELNSSWAGLSAGAIGLHVTV